MEPEIRQRLDVLILLILTLLAFEGYQLAGLAGVFVALLFVAGVVHVFIPSATLGSVTRGD
ncbi:hypothetical protein [Haloferax elongans]|nr:hypothetical protein [Haloferax elongans]